MKAYSVTNARAELYKLLNGVNENHEPVNILGKHGNGVLIAEDDWRAIEETLYLTSIPGLAETILEGDNEKLEDMVNAEELDWDE